jgi:hypothetical protein
MVATYSRSRTPIEPKGDDMPARFTATLAICLCLALTAGGIARAEDPPTTKKADIQQLIKLSGSGALSKRLSEVISQSLANSLRHTQPNVPAKALEIIKRETAALVTERIEAPGGMLDRMVPLYAKNFTHQEIRELIAFYQSPTGKKVMALTPELAREREKLSQELLQGIGPELQRRIDAAFQKEGYTKKKP